MPSIKDLERKELLVPVVASAVTAAGAYAATKVPSLMNGSGSGIKDKIGEGIKDKVGEQATELKEGIEDSGGPLAIAAKATDKLGGGGGGGGGSRGKGSGRGRRLPIQASVDVAVPVSFAYDQWTDLKKLGNFLHRVESVEPKGDKRVVWHENIWGRRRTWRAEITEKRRNQLIAWKDDHGTGVLSFHPLAPRLTRVELNYDWVPHGMMEKLASGLRFHRRAARTDLQRFKAHSETEYAKQRAGNGESKSKSKSKRTASPRRRQPQRA